LLLESLIVPVFLHHDPLRLSVRGPFRLLPRDELLEVRGRRVRDHVQEDLVAHIGDLKVERKLNPFIIALCLRMYAREKC
jgi:hypothetical protein